MSDETNDLTPVEGGDGISVIRGSGICRSWNNIRYKTGMSATNVGSKKLSQASGLSDWLASFGVSQAQTLVIPLEAVRTFVDPSVKFGLKFDGHEAEDDDDFEPVALEPDDPDDSDEGAAEEGSADVVSLDKFRKT